MSGWLDTLNDIGDALDTELGGAERVYRFKGDGLFRIVSNDKYVRVEGDLQQRVPSIMKSVPPV